MRKLIRKEEYEFQLNIADSSFINPPKVGQRNALLNKVMKEIAGDLEALHEIAGGFVEGHQMKNLDDRSQTSLTDAEIMEDWQIPLMKAMAEAVGNHGGDILEVGFGRGVSSTFIQEYNISSHTIIECNEDVIDRFHNWKTKYEDKKIDLISGLWQDTIGSLGQFDGIFFHTYPLNEEEYVKYVHGDVTFAGHFFSHAAEHLKEGGVFSYMTNEIDSLSRAHQRILLKYFSEVSIKILPLSIPHDVVDSWWADRMVLVKVIK